MHDTSSAAPLAINLTSKLSELSKPRSSNDKLDIVESNLKLLKIALRVMKRHPLALQDFLMEAFSNQ
jgi:hypothetical protein